MEANSTAAKLADLGTRMDDAVHASGAQAVEKQHARGKMTARERILALVDEGSFTEMDEFARHRSTAFGMEAKRPYGDGVVIGLGRSMNARSASSVRTSASSAARWARSTARRSPRSSTSPPPPGAR